MGLGCASCVEPLGMDYLRGLGACGDCLSYDDSGDAGPVCVSIDSSGCGGSAGTFTASDCAYGGVYPNCLPAPLSQAPASGGTVATNNAQSAQTTNALASLAAAWTKIAGQTIAPQTTIQTPSGLQIQTPAAQTSALANLFGGGGSLFSSQTAGQFGSYLPLLFVVGLGIWALSAVRGRR